MRFDPAQGARLQAFMAPIAKECLRIAKPGAFAACCSQPRLHHRMAIAWEEGGWEIRDLYAWRFGAGAQAKAFRVTRFIDGWAGDPAEKARLRAELADRCTAQLRPEFETIVLAQKPKQGTHVDNWDRHRTGLADATVTVDGKGPTTLMAFPKPRRDPANRHLTVKPVGLMAHLIRLLSAPGQTVLDPFVGSGTTAVAAIRTGRGYIGIEADEGHAAIARRRIETERGEHGDRLPI